MRRAYVISIMLLAVCTSAQAKLLPYATIERPHLPLSGGQAGCTRVQYNGGALLQHVKIVQVAWSSATAYQSELAQFYASMVQSPYLDWIGEYNGGGQSLGRGSFVGAFVDPSPPPLTTVNQVTDVEPELKRLIDAELVPAPDADTLYMIHFPPGVNITMDGGYESCVGTNPLFCAFHYFTPHTNGNVRYAVIPDMASGLCGDCADGTGDPFIGTTLAASHEMMEAITDPDPPEGWSDDQCGELADMCDDEITNLGSIGSYTVEKIWSVMQQACVDRPGPPVTTQRDFSVTLDPPTVQAVVGDPASVWILAAPVGASPVTTISLSFDGLPLAVEGKLSASAILSDDSAVLNFDIGAAAPPGQHSFRITAVSGGVVHTADGILVLKPRVSTQPDMGGTQGEGSACLTNADCMSGLCVPLPGHGLQCVSNMQNQNNNNSGGCSSMGGAPLGTSPLLLVVLALVARLPRRRSR